MTPYQEGEGEQICLSCLEHMGLVSAGSQSVGSLLKFRVDGHFSFFCVISVSTNHVAGGGRSQSV